MTEADIAYAAGFFDGEGSVSIFPNTSGHATVHVGVCQKDSANSVLHWLHESFGAGSVTVSQPTGTHKCMMSTWQIGGRSAIEFLTAIRPFLRVKGEQVDIALALLSIPRYSKDPRDKVLGLALMDAMRTLRGAA